MGGSSDLLVPDRDTARRIWDALTPQGAFFVEVLGSGPDDMQKGSVGMTFSDFSVECDRGDSLVHALFLHAFYAKWGFLPKAGKEEMDRFRREGRGNRLYYFMRDFYSFQEVILDFMNDVLYSEGHTDKLAAELSPPLIGQADPEMPLTALVTRLGDLSCSFPSCIEVIDVVGNVIRQMLLSTGNGKETRTSPSRTVERFPVGSFPLVFISRASVVPLDIHRERSVANMGMSAIIAPGATVPRLAAGTIPFISRKERTLLIEDYTSNMPKNRGNALVFEFASSVGSETYSCLLPGAPRDLDTESDPGSIISSDFCRGLFSGVKPSAILKSGTTLRAFRESLVRTPPEKTFLDFQRGEFRVNMPLQGAYTFKTVKVVLMKGYRELDDVLPVSFYEAGSSLDPFETSSLIRTTLVPVRAALITYYESHVATNTGNLG